MRKDWRSFWTGLRRQLAESHRRAARSTGILLAIAFVLGYVLTWGQAVYGQGGEKTGSGKPTAAATNSKPGPVNGLPSLDIKVGGRPGDSAQLIQVMLLFTLLSLAPSIVIMLTPFTRIVIVLSLLRNAMGTQQAPPNNVIVGLALFLSFFIMAPYLNKANTDAVQPYLNGTMPAEEALSKAQVPLRAFMLRQTRARDLALFTEMAKLDRKQTRSSEVPMHVVIPAFMTSELKSAFQIGFVIYLPFLVIDMVVSAILMSMGMLMLPPVLVSLPFKLLMFVLSDGWNLVFGSLMRSYKAAAI